jgi:hypothetical protein
MLLVSVASKPSEAAQRMEKYQEHLKKIEAPSSIAEGFPDGCVRVEDRYSGECVVGQSGRFLVFLIGKAQNGQKIMAELWKNLQCRQQAESSASASQG